MGNDNYEDFGALRNNNNGVCERDRGGRWRKYEHDQGQYMTAPDPHTVFASTWIGLCVFAIGLSFFA